MAPNPHRVEILERHGGWRPPFPLRDVVERVVQMLSPAAVSTLSRIELTTARALLATERDEVHFYKGTEVPRHQARGVYFGRGCDAGPRIVLHCDNILPGPALVWSLSRKVAGFAIAATLFHEIAHHLHFEGTKVDDSHWLVMAADSRHAQLVPTPIHDDIEDVAEHWARMMYYRLIGDDLKDSRILSLCADFFAPAPEI